MNLGDLIDSEIPVRRSRWRHSGVRIPNNSSNRLATSWSREQEPYEAEGTHHDISNYDNNHPLFASGRTERDVGTAAIDEEAMDGLDGEEPVENKGRQLPLVPASDEADG